MATAVASRFSVLKIEGDDDDDAPKKQQKKKTDGAKKPGNSKPDQNQKKKVKKPESSKQTQQPNTKNKGKQNSKGDGAQKKKGDKQMNLTKAQWDEWKKKDTEMAEGTYEQDLSEAILLSKLDYEEKKEVYERMRKEAEEEKKWVTAKKGKKTCKAQPMSLEEFNNLHTIAPDIPSISTPVPESANSLEDHDTEFFNRVEEDARKVVDRERSLEHRKALEPFIDETITLAQYQDMVEKRDAEIETLKEEITRLKDELHIVKTRNKKLCNILALGEMKDKAEVLVEVERLQQMRDELSSEVSNLHAQLEQERSKVRALTVNSDQKSKSQLKLLRKNVRFDASDVSCGKA